MQEQTPKSSASGAPSDGKPETKAKESKIRIGGDDAPSRFGENPASFQPTPNPSPLRRQATEFNGLISGTPLSELGFVAPLGGASPPKPVEDNDEKEEKKHQPQPPVTAPQPAVSHPELQRTLQRAYRDKHSLFMPLSNKPFPIQAVSLTVNEKSVQEAQRRQPLKDEKEKKIGDKKSSTSSWSDQLQREEDWHKVEKPLEMKAIFIGDPSGEAKTASPHKPVQRVLVEGRAGVGKTTFSQYLAWQWATAGLYAEPYDYLLLVPLRRWLTGPVTDHFQEELAAFLYESYCPPDTSAERFKELQAILSAEGSTRTLLILDGFDEVAHHLEEPDSPQGQLLMKALQCQHVMVTTRDYQLPPSPIRFDRQLVNIGFTDAQIKQYLQHYTQWLNPTPAETQADGKDKESKYDTPSTSSLSSLPRPTDSPLSRTLQQNSRLWALAHVPLNLALMVEVFGDELAEAKDIDSPSPSQDISLTGLYQKVLECFLLRQLARQGIKPKLYTPQTLRNRQFIALDALSLIAWGAFQAGEILLSASTQQTALTRLAERYPQIPDTDIEAHFLQALTMGLLRSEGLARKNPLDQSRYFIHLTFQEYFTAYYLLQNLQGYYGEKAYEDSLTWISQHKYEPRYAVVMGFLAGLSTDINYDQALQAFWHAILSPPHDFVGASHIRLVMRCLEEAQLDKRIPARAALLDLLPKWMDYALRHRESQYPYKSKVPWFIESLCTCPRLLREGRIVAQCLQALQDKDMLVCAVEEALGKIGQVAPQLSGLAPGLLQALQDKDEYVRRAAASALGKIGQVAPQLSGLALALLQALQDEDRWVREEAANALGKIGQVAPHSGLVPGLLQALQDKHVYVQRAATSALGKIGQVAPQVPGLVPGLLQALQDENEWVRETVAKALGQIGQVAPQLSGLAPGLLQALQDKESLVRYAAAEVLSKIGQVAPQLSGLRQGLLQALQDKDSDVCQVAAEALDKIGQVAPQLSGLALGLLQALQDKDKDVRRAAAEALGKIGQVAPQLSGLVPGLLQALQDKEWPVREAVLYALGKIGQVAPQLSGLVPGLLQALRDKEWPVREATVNALGKIGQVAPHSGLVPGLLQALQDENESVRETAAKALGKIGQVTPQLSGLVLTLLQALQDKDKYVRASVARALGEIGQVAPQLSGLVPGLLQALQDEHEYTRELAAEALGQIALVERMLNYWDVVRLARTQHQTITDENMAIWSMVLTFSFPGIVWHADTLQLITGTQSESVTVPDTTALPPLLAAINKQWQKDGLPPPPTLAECQEKPRVIQPLKNPPLNPHRYLYLPSSPPNTMKNSARRDRMGQRKLSARHSA